MTSAYDPKELQIISDMLMKIADELPEEITFGQFSFLMYTLAMGYNIGADDLIECAMNARLNIEAEKRRNEAH